MVFSFPPQPGNSLTQQQPSSHHQGVQLSELSFRVNGNTLDLTGAVASNDGGTNPSNEGLDICIFLLGGWKSLGLGAFFRMAALVVTYFFLKINMFFS